jgi:hypothetical protein
MTERERIAGLAEQIDLAKKHVSEWPEWLRSSAHFAGTNHSLEEDQPDLEKSQPETAKEPVKFG